MYQIPTKDNFESLTEDKGESTENNSNKQKEMKPLKFKPIFVTGVLQIDQLNETIKTIVNNDLTKYTLTTIKSDHIVKLIPSDVETYKAIRRHFTENNISHYTYLLKHERPYCVVLRGVHYTTDIHYINNIITELQKHGHKTTYITNVLHRSIKEPLPLF